VFVRIDYCLNSAPIWQPAPARSWFPAVADHFKPTRVKWVSRDASKTCPFDGDPPMQLRVPRLDLIKREAISPRSDLSYSRLVALRGQTEIEDSFCRKYVDQNQ
jgi:hypothetical protein